MKKDFFYKKIKDGENKKTFLLGMLFSYKKKTSLGYIDRRFFGLWKAKKKNHTVRYYFCGLYVWKKTLKEDMIKEIIAIREEIIDYLLKANVSSILFANNNDDNLFYIQTPSCLLLFSKKAFRHNCIFIQDYFYSILSYLNKPSFKIMSPDCSLYKEHIDKFKSDNVLLYKYLWRGGLVYRTIISKDADGSDLYLETSYLGLDNYQADNGRKYLNTPRRKIVKGITVYNYLKNKTDEDQKKILKDFFDWLFETYQYPNDKDKLDGRMVDCNLSNFLIKGKNFVPIDIEFEMEDGLSKDLCLWYALGRKEVASPHYGYFLDVYNLKRMTGPHPFWIENKNLETAAVLNECLREKYFTEKYLIPEYD